MEPLSLPNQSKSRLRALAKWGSMADVCEPQSRPTWPAGEAAFFPAAGLLSSVSRWAQFEKWRLFSPINGRDSIASDRANKARRAAATRLKQFSAEPKTKRFHLKFVTTSFVRRVHRDAALHQLRKAPAPARDPVRAGNVEICQFL